ncbi:MAG: glycosyltransferase family 2 protein [Gemmatimonadaceae bacterium]
MTLISILIPCYQEADFIEGCLSSIVAFETPPAVELEILILDGMSTDGTRKTVARFSERDDRVRLVDNPGRTQSKAMNLGIDIASGDFLMRLDAHSVYPPDYLRLTYETALRTGAHNTGGVVATLPRGEGYQASLVQALTTHRFGVGDSSFRTDATEGETDTVPYGFFKREIFERVGFFDERLLRAQDYEMNRRIGASGGKVWINPAIQVRYFQQPDLPTFIRKQIVHEAPYNAYMWYVAPYAFALRHAVTGVFSAGVIGGALLALAWPPAWKVYLAIAGLYLLLAIGSSIQQAVRYREGRHVVVLPVAFFLYHFLHGVGVLAGLGRLLVGSAPVQRLQEPWPGAGRKRAWPFARSERSI